MAVLMPITSPFMLSSGPPECLDEVVVLALSDDAVLGAHDPGGDGVTQTEGVADGDHPLARTHMLGIAQRQCEERLVRLDLDQRDVGVGVTADDGGLELGAVLEGHLDAVDRFDHVVVGHDVAVGRDHEAGPQALALVLALAAVAVLPEQVLEGAAREEVLELRSGRPAHRP
jgi:hypothetical protein